MSLSKVIGDFIDIDDAKDFAAGAVESVTGTLDMMDIPRNYLMSQVGMQPPGTYTDAARDALNLQPNTESSAYMAGQIVGGAATGGAGAIRQAGKQGLKYATKEAGKQLGYEGLATAGSEAGAQAGQYLGGDTAEFVGSLAGGVVTGSAGQTLGNPNKMDIFAGTRSDTIDPMMVNSAVAMEKAGKSKTEIWNKTGMMRGADGNWRYEIDDSKADIRLFSQDDIGKDPVRAYQVLQHDELYRAYPDLANVAVRAMNEREMYEMAGVAGFYSPYANTVAINPKMDERNQRDTLLHEMQHVVQQREGHSGGSNADISREYLEESYYAQQEKLRKSLPNNPSMIDVYEAQSLDEARLQQIIAMADYESILSMNNISQPKQLYNSNLWYRHSDKVRALMPKEPRRGQRRLEWTQEAGKIVARLEMDRLANSGEPSDLARWNMMSPRLLGSDLGRDELESVRKDLRSMRGKRDRARDRMRLYDFDQLDRKYQNQSQLFDRVLYKYTEGEAEAFTTGQRQFEDAAWRRRNTPMFTMGVDLDLDSDMLIPQARGLNRAERTDGGVLDMVRREEMKRGVLIDAK